MNEQVRPGVRADRAALEFLQAAARRQVADQRGGQAWLAESPPLDWAEDLADTLVATLDGVVVGYLQLRVDADPAEVVQVYVQPEARDMGLGELLLERAIERARAAGCLTIQGWALPGDRATKNLFERNSMVARKIIVSRAI